MLYRRKHGKKLVLVYSMGKVGTTSLYNFFRRQHPEIPVHHVHFLSDTWVKEKIPKLNPFFHGNIEAAQKVYDSIAKFPTHRIKIITFVREPLMREISDIFQNAEGIEGLGKISELTYERAAAYLDACRHDYVLQWFDSEFAQWTGFDIYSVPFNKEKGYSVYHTDRADILCIKTERINECLPDAIAAFMGMEMEVSAASNTSENKEGKDIYTELRNRYRAPDEKLKLLYNSRYVRHFYSNAEIDNFVRKWSGKEKSYSDIQKA